MGDNFVIIADVDATEDEAPALAELIVRWLANDGIIVPDATDCVLGAEGGYAPGPLYTVAVTDPDVYLRQRRTNGIGVSTGRCVFHPGQGELGPVICPRCGQTVVLENPVTGKPTELWEPFSDALDTWYAGGTSELHCAHCAKPVAFNDWQWVGELPFALGFLGFTFWNWPPLRDTFITAVANQLRHRVVVTKGKL